MFPFWEVLLLVLKALVRALTDPLFWLVVLIVAVQYRRIAGVQEKFFGLKSKWAWREIFSAVGYGLIGGLMGSMLLSLIGLTLSGSGLMYLWPVAIILMLIDARFLCFAYSGGILALANLLLGWPRVSVAQVLGLVAVLHMVESLLIYLSGHRQAVPAFIRSPRDRVVGGFVLQKFWPIPLAALAVVSHGQWLSMPDWWPFIKSGLIGRAGNLFYTMIPVVAGLGYGDVAIVRTPERKSRLAALYLSIYSITLLALAVLADRYKLVGLVAAVFSPLGHELVIHLGKQAEFQGESIYLPDSRGLKLLDVIDHSPAWQSGLRSGDIITEINRQPVFSRQEMELLLRLGPNPADIAWLSQDGAKFDQVVLGREGQLGVLPVPEGHEEAYMELSTAGPIGRWWSAKRPCRR